MRKLVTRTYLDTPDPWSKPELQIRELESKRAQNLSARDLVLCFPLCVSDTSDWKNYFPVLYPASFNRFQRKKNPCCSRNKLCLNDTRVEEDVLMIFDELKEQSPSSFSFSWRWPFLKRASHPRDNYECGLWPNKQTPTHLRLCLRILSSPNRTF